MTQTPLTETRRFKVMRTFMGAANPLIKRFLGSRLGVPVDDEGRIAEVDKAGADVQALVVEVRLGQPIEAPAG